MSDTTDDALADTYGWFTVLWPLAVLFHLAGNDVFLLRLTEVGIWQVPFLIAAIYMLFRPSSRAALVLALAHLPVVATKLPVVGNHEILLLLVHLTVIFAVVTKEKRWVAAAVPPLRWVLLIGYSAMAFSKLNSSFVDRAVSCAVVFGDEFGDWVNVTVSNSPALSAMVIAVTLIAELSIPILLMIRRVRHIGIIVGLAFHTILALEPIGHVFDFTSTLFLLFLLFLEPGVSSQLTAKVASIHQPQNARRVGAALAVLIVGNVLIRGLRAGGSDVPNWLIEYPMWLVYAALLLKTVFGLLRGRDRAPVPLAFRFAPIMAVVVLLTSLNAASPYLELRTAGAFNMYSNLSIYDGTTNHFLVPATLPLRETPPLYSYEPSPEIAIGLDFYADTGLLLPENNLALWTHTFPFLDVPVDQETGDGLGSSISVRDLDHDNADSFVNRLLYIRAVDPTEPTTCKRFWGPSH